MSAAAVVGIATWFWVQSDSAWERTQEIRSKLSDAKRDDVRSWLALADWFSQRKDPISQEFCYRSILRLDPDHADARAKLGYAKIDGAWVSSIDRLLVDTAKKKSEGLMLFGDEWVNTNEELLRNERKKVGWDFDLKIRSAHWVIYTDASEEVALRVLKVAEATFEAFVEDMIGTLPIKPAPKAMRIFLFKDRERYQKEARLPTAWAEGYYNSSRAACFCYYDARNDKNPTHWIVHEAVHQLMFELISEPADVTNWLSEGYACYFGTSKLVGGELKLGQVDPDTYPAWWRSRYAPEKFMTLSDLLDVVGPNLDRQRDPNPFYLQSWLFVHYLLHGEDGKHRKAFRSFLVQAVQGKSRTPTFEKIVGRLADLEAGYLKYAKDMQSRQ